MDGLKEVYSKFFNPLRNAYSFFVLYANVDNIDTDECNVNVENREEIDKWLISKYNTLVKDVNEAFLEYDLNKVVRFLTSFVSDDLSNWYIRRNRNRFWGSELNNSKKSVYITTYEVLVGLAKLCAPITPFLSEEIYRNLTGGKSVHLETYPEAREELIDKKLEEKMDLVRSLISIGRMVREEQKIKVRQPLSEALIDGSNKEILEDLVPLIKEELNVKEVTFTNDLSLYMNYTLKPNFKVVGKIMGPNIKEFQMKLETLSNEDIDSLVNNKTITMNIGGNDITINSEMIEIRILEKEGFNVGRENNLFIILNTELSHELILEGLAREFVSKVQNIRKAEDYNVADRIEVTYNGDDLVQEMVKEFEEFIKGEILAVAINYDESTNNKLDLNGHEVNILTRKA